MRVNQIRRELCLKIVYYGPGPSGKTTNLIRLHQTYPQHQRGDLVQLDTETERTLFFDYFPLSMGNIGGYRVKVDFFTVPGQSFYNATRRAVLEGVDGIVFVADSTPEREEANLISREDMLRNLDLTRRKLADVPHVYQWNKRDARGALKETMLQRQLNPEGAPAVAATAIDGVGVWETQGLILRQVFENLREEHRSTRQNA